MSLTKFEEILQRFNVVSRNGDRAQALCPAHKDKQASLTISRGDKCVLLHCHAGCDTSDVLAAVGLKLRDTYYDSEPQKITWKTFVEGKEKRKIEDVYDYVNMLDGAYCFSKIRLEGKRIIYGKIANGRFSYGLSRSTPRKSYKAIFGNVIEINRAVAEGKAVFIPEGEKDVLTLRKNGYAAFTYGGVSDWQSDFSQLVKDATVYILADNDPPGKKVAETILNDIKPVAKAAKIIVPVPDIQKADVTDFFERGGTKEEFEKMLVLEEIDFNGDYSADIKTEKQQIDEIVEVLKAVDAAHTYSTTDKGTGKLFADIFKNKHRYNPDMKEFMTFEKRWKKDVEGMDARRSAKLLVDALTKYAAQVELSEKDQSNYFKFVYNLTFLRNRNTMLNDAKDHFYFTNAELDQNGFLLNCQNGVLDISGDEEKFLPHSADLMLSKIANVNYDPKAEGKIWGNFVNEIMQNDVEKIKYLQKICGLSLTADTSQETMFIFYGATTRNGKSTFVETIGHMLGDYAVSMRPESLAVKQNADSRQANGDIARLKGVRFVSASEPPKRMIFDVALLKTLLGRDVVTARHLHEREFQFLPVFKLILNTNYLPQILDDTVFSSGRINVISFDRHFTPSEQDKTLKSKLRCEKEMSGILNWCIEGLKLYRKEGLEPPKLVVEATQEYRLKSDKIGSFISERLEKTGRNSRAGDIYEIYSEWCSDGGYGTENKANFFSEMKSRGLFSLTGTVNGKTCRNVIKAYQPAFSEAENESPFD